MADIKSRQRRASRDGRLACAVWAIVTGAVFVGLEGRGAPFSMEFRRAIGLVALAPVVATFGIRCRASSLTALVVAASALVFLARAPSISAGTTAFVVALAAFELMTEAPLRGERNPTASASILGGCAAPPPGMLQACLTYAALCLATGLVPYRAAMPDAVADAWFRFIQSTWGASFRDGSTSLTGAWVGLSVLLLLWSYRYVGGRARLGTAAALSIAWFALPPLLDLNPTEGPLAAFCRASAYGFAWLALGLAATIVLPHERLVNFHGPQLEAGVALIPRPHGKGTRRKVGLALASFAAALAGSCLTGTSLIGRQAGRSVLVHNYGGLDWDRPIFGRFGPFSNGMFGILPVHCRAEGYDFNALEKTAIEPSDLEETQILVLINSPKIWDDRERKIVLDFVSARRKSSGSRRSHRRVRPNARVQQPGGPGRHPIPFRLGYESPPDMARLPGGGA